MDILKRIDELKNKRNAVILAHNYMIAEVQEAADYVGDSLGLSITASKVDADVIVFCGVDFMAESAKILSPDKTIIHPESGAKCPMAAMCTPDALLDMRKKYPEAKVVGYVNSSAECKAEMDLCCTSANAVKVVKSLEVEKVIFVPDCNLGHYVQRFVPDKEIILWPGFCPTHQGITPEQVKSLKAEHPSAIFMAHPECRPEIIDIADFVDSTNGMINFVSETDADEVIVGTELDMVYPLSKKAPNKKFYWLPNAICPTMKMITLDSIIRSLERMEYKVELPKETIERAKLPLERMTQIGR
ncbi:MAG: quinolinate synthase NadA [Methanomassiliicoccales archaeon]|nr:quinolinate synthase NadA [Methanomassiliicoccales archaeon]